MTAKESPVRYPGLPSEPATALPEVSSLLPCSYQGELKERGGGQTGLLVLVLVDCPEEAKSLKPFSGAISQEEAPAIHIAGFPTFIVFSTDRSLG